VLLKSNPPPENGGAPGPNGRVGKNCATFETETAGLLAQQRWSDWNHKEMRAQQRARLVFHSSGPVLRANA